MRRSITALAVAASLALASVAHADGASSQAAAQALFEEGRKLVQDGKYAEACPKLAESERLDPAPGTLLNLAGCYEKAGKSASAWATFKDAASLARQAGRADYEAVARDHLAKLEPMLSTLAITVAAPVDGLVVSRDGVGVGRAEWGVAIPVDPGEHTIDVTAPDKAPWSTKVQVDAGAAHASVSVPALGDAPLPPTPGSPTGVSRRTVGLVVGGVGVVSLGLGTFFGLRAKSKEDDAFAYCRPGTTLCTADGVSLGSDAKSAATASTITFALGAAAIVGGVVLFATAPSTTGGTSVALRVAPAPGGAAMSLGGAW